MSDLKHGLPPVNGTLRRVAGYSSNLRIPAELRDAFSGAEHHRRSLKTRDPKAAEKAIRRIQVELDDRLEACRSAKAQEAALANLTEEQRSLYVAAGGLSGLLKQYEDTMVGRKFMRAGDPTEYAEDDEERNPSEVRMEIAEHRAAYSVLTDDARERAKALRAIGTGVEVPGGDVTGLRELAQAYFEENNTPVNGQRHYTYPVRRFIELHGDLPLGDLTMDHIRTFAQEMRRTTSSRKDDIVKLAFWENVKKAKALGLKLTSDKARKNATDSLKGLTKFGVTQGYLKADPFAGFAIRVGRKKYSASAPVRLAFDGDAARRIVDYAANNRHPGSVDRWAPLLALYLGARREEIGQMQCRDVTEIDGEWIIRITDEGENGKVKNRDSLRNIPLHSVVIEAGFLDFAQRRKASAEPTDFLFREEVRKGSGELRDVRLDNDGRLTDAFGKRFAADLRSQGLKRPEWVFHSTRHTWETAAEAAEMPDSHRRALAGRAALNGDSQALYGDGPSICQGRAALEKIDPLSVKIGVGIR